MDQIKFALRKYTMHTFGANSPCKEIFNAIFKCTTVFHAMGFCLLSICPFFKIKTFLLFKLENKQ